jgi:2-keto-3-deoxy-L-rhamnonate aldolase RhmA
MARPMGLEHTRPRLFRSEDPPIGLFVLELFSPNLWSMLTLGGLDFAVVDLEHSRFTTEEVAAFGAGANGSSIPLLVRIPRLDREAIGRVLDLGAAGVIVSRIETREEAEQLVRWTKFAPMGMRNAAFGVAYDSFQTDSWAETAAWANERTICIPLIETAAGADNIEEICAVADLDAIWVGPADMSQSLGRIGDLTSPEYTAVEESILEAAAAHDIPVGVWARTQAEIERQLARGYRAIAIGTDSAVLISALRESVARIKETAAT